MKSLLAIYVWAVLFTASACAASQSILIRAGHVLDVNSGKESLNQGILIEGGRIASIGDFKKIRAVAPQGAMLIDLSNQWVLPGFIDCHTHLLTELKHAEPGKDALATFVMHTSRTERIGLGAKMGREDLEAGITTVRDVGNSDVNGDVELRNRINAGTVVGPRMIVSTRAISARGGQFWDNSGLTPEQIGREYAVVSNPEQARAAVLAAKKDGADVIKIIVDGTQLLSQQEVNTMVEVAHSKGMKVAAHAISSKGVDIAVAAGVDSVEHGYFANPNALERMAAKGMFLVPTDGALNISLAEAEPPFTDHYDPQNEASVRRFEAKKRETLRVAVAKGVRIAAGSDDYMHVAGKTRGDVSLTWVEAYQDAGMTAIEIIQSMTVNAAELLGWEDRIGSLEQGKFADIVAVSQDPLENVTTLEDAKFVMKNGEIVKNNASHRRRLGFRHQRKE